MTLLELDRLVSDRRQFHVPLLEEFAAQPVSLTPSLADAEARFSGHLLDRMYADPALHSGVPRQDGLNLYRLLRSEPLEETLELGLGYGFSTLFCLQAHEDRGSGRHMAIDPCQLDLDPRTLEKNAWSRRGLKAVRDAGLERRLQYSPEPDFLALPEMIRTARRFDLCLIDAMGLFDLVTVNAVHCDMLLRSGGILVFRVCWPGIMKSVLFWLQNRAYTLLRVEPMCSQLVFLRKVADDTRHWTHFRDF